MEEELREQCRRSVRQVLARRGWALVQDDTAFVEEVLAEVQRRLQNSRASASRPLEKIIEDATVNRYCYLWHAACGVDGTLRQRQAFKELHHYLYPVALYRAKHDQHIAEESTQEALIKVWQHLDQVRDPGSFARWAGVIVSNEVKQKLRERTQEVEVEEGTEVRWQIWEISETDMHLRGEARSSGIQTRGIGDRPDLSPVDQGPKMTDELRARIETAIGHCLRSEQQQAVIIGLFLDHKSFKEVADALDTTPQNVSVLKSRALKRLRECEEFLEALEDLM